MGPDSIGLLQHSVAPLFLLTLSGLLVVRGDEFVQAVLDP